MASRKQHSDPPYRQTKVSRRQAAEGAGATGNFRYADGNVVQDVVYAGALPLDAHPGMSIPAIRPGNSNFVYPPRGSIRWVSDLLIMVLIGCAVGFLLLASTLGLRRRNTSRTGFA